MKTTLFSILAVTLFLSATAQAKSVWLTQVRDRSLIQKADFETNWSRNPSPDALIYHFQSTFPLVNFTYVNNSCVSIDDSNKTLLGVDDPLAGTALLRKPSPGFVTWYTDCTRQIIQANALTFFANGGQQKEIAKPYLAGGVAETCAKNSGATYDPANGVSVTVFLRSCKWASFSAAGKLAVARNWIEELIGPEDVVKDLGLAASSDELAQKIVDTVSAEDQKPTGNWGFLQIMGGNLDLLSATEMTQFLVSITDAFQY